MITYDRSRRPRAAAAPWASLGAVLVASLVLALLPPRATAPLKNTVSILLTPGQRWATGVREQASRALANLNHRLAAAEEQRTAAEELDRLRQRNQELETALALAIEREHSAEEEDAPASASAPLIRPALVQARVLGPQARAFLQRLEIVDAGTDAGLESDSLVFAASPVVLDQGRNAGLSLDDVALAGRSVVGRLVEVRPQTSVVRTVTDAAYRDLVQLAEPAGERLRRGPRGVLEGTGESLCRIRLVEVTEPVSVGDLVLAAGEAGAGASDAVYGRVARVERRAGDAHWQIWMEPAAGRESPREVAVLRLQLNPERLARAPSEARSN